MAQAQEQEKSDSQYSVDLMQVQPEFVDQAWPLVSVFLLPAFETTNKLEEEGAKLLCQEEYAQLWVFWSPDMVAADGNIGALVGAAITDMTTHTNGYKVLSFLAVGGTQAKIWMPPMIRKIEDFAIAEECNAVEMIGRQGWGRVFPDYTQTAWIYTKELPDGRIDK